MNSIAKLGLMSILMAALPATAHAQFARDNGAPISATADNIVNASNVTTLTGQVDVRQGDVRILADIMKIYGGVGAGSGAANDISKIEANGNFYYLTPEQEVRGANGVYVQATEEFTVTGDVVFLQGDDNIVTGDTLIYNLKTTEARVIGTCKGRRCGSKGRVKILLKNTGDNPAS